jgi:hypothetical protein
MTLWLIELAYMKLWIILHKDKLSHTRTTFIHPKWKLMNWVQQLIAPCIRPHEKVDLSRTALTSPPITQYRARID